MIDSDSPQTPQTGRIVFIGAVHEARPALDVLLASPLVRVAAVITATPDGLANWPARWISPRRRGRPACRSSAPTT